MKVLIQEATPPTLSSSLVVDKFVARPPRVRTNLDGEVRMIGTAYILNSPLWLSVITYQKRRTYRVRTWLRCTDKKNLLIQDKDGFYTATGAMWAAFGELATIVNDLNAGKRLSQ